MENNEMEFAGTSQGWGRKFVLVLGALLALAANGYMLVSLSRLGGEVKQLRASLGTAQLEIAQIHEASAAATAASRQRLESLGNELQAARRQAATAVGKAKIEAQRHADQLAGALALEQQKHQEQTTTQLSEVKEAASAANTRISDVSTEVTGVRSEVASTKSEVDRLLTDLKRVNGDLGVMSGLIATNSRELGALRQLGERNYFEFTLAKGAQPQKVGDIRMTVKKIDSKRHKYTMEVFADDKRVEKKDKGINEPVQFYVAGTRQPYEFVVNQVRPDRLVGYLATPKVQIASR